MSRYSDWPQKEHFAGYLVNVDCFWLSRENLSSNLDCRPVQRGCLSVCQECLSGCLDWLTSRPDVRCNYWNCLSSWQQCLSDFYTYCLSGCAKYLSQPIHKESLHFGLHSKFNGNIDSMRSYEDKGSGLSLVKNKKSYQCFCFYNISVNFPKFCFWSNFSLEAAPQLSFY